MNEPTKEQIARLPKWAQMHIVNCERQRDSAQRELRRLMDNTSESRLFVKAHTLKIGDRMYIPSDEVTFILGDRAEISIRVERDLLHCMGSGSVRTQLLVKPRVTNVLDLSLE